jgi:hypothetical protein
VGVFVEIPVVSNYAFWVLVVAYLSWHVFHRHNAKNRFRWQIMVSLVLLFGAIVGVFADIPIISDYAFWVLLVAYLLIVGSTSFT